MARVAVVGAGVSGLAACVALARDGHDITLFERDPIEPAADPHEAFEADRRGAPQIRHGVRISDGTEERFDLSVVASGRRGALPAWLADVGAGEVPELTDESGIVYFSRFLPPAARPGTAAPHRTHRR